MCMCVCVCGVCVCVGGGSISSVKHHSDRYIIKTLMEQSKWLMDI